MTSALKIAALAAVVCVTWCTRIVAQQDGTTKQGFSGSAGFGLSLTSGNSQTINVNATMDSVYDTKTGNVMKWNALFLRGKQNGAETVNRVSGMFRDEDTVSGRLFVFGQIDTLHDTFKEIDYLFAPSAGLGIKPIDRPPAQLSLDAGLGGVVEKDTNLPARGSGAITVSEKFVEQLTATTTLKQGATSLLKMNNFSDGLYTFEAGVAMKISQRVSVSIDLLDTYKNRPLPPATLQNDVALVTSVVAKY